MATAGAPIGVWQFRPLVLDDSERVNPGRDRAGSGVDSVLNVGEHFGVVEEHQMGVKDLRLLGPHLPGGDGSNALDLPTHGGYRLDDTTPFSRWAACGAGMGRGCRGVQHPDWSDTDAW
jgi:hypothetical protein